MSIDSKTRATRLISMRVLSYYTCHNTGKWANLRQRCRSNRGTGWYSVLSSGDSYLKLYLRHITLRIGASILNFQNCKNKVNQSFDHVDFISKNMICNRRHSWYALEHWKWYLVISYKIGYWVYNRSVAKVSAAPHTKDRKITFTQEIRLYTR